jgi:hypothetical protein
VVNICAQVSTNKMLVVNTNNVLPPNETNFFAVNSNLLNQSVAASGGGGGGGGAWSGSIATGITNTGAQGITNGGPLTNGGPVVITGAGNSSPTLSLTGTGVAGQTATIQSVPSGLNLNGQVLVPASGPVVIPQLTSDSSHFVSDGNGNVTVNSIISGPNTSSTDSGFSRVAKATYATGNGTPGDVSGTNIAARFVGAINATNIDGGPISGVSATNVPLYGIPYASFTGAVTSSNGVIAPNNLLWWGADPTMVNDSSVALQNWLNYGSASANAAAAGFTNFVHLTMPPGKFIFSNELSFTNATGVVIEGAGDSTELCWYGASN